MAIGKDGPLGHYKGKIGPNYGYIMHNKQIIRAAPHITKPRSEKQIAQQSKMTVMSTMLNLIKVYLRVGFASTAAKKDINAASAAKSYNLKQAIIGTYPDFEIDYPQVRLTDGNLAAALHPEVQAVAEGFRFTWDYDAHDMTGSSFDRTMLMAYFPEKKQFFQMIGGLNRDSCAETLAVYESAKGYEAETYISFITSDHRSISNSIYTGRITF
jgi:hypothetical protein